MIVAIAFVVGVVVGFVVAVAVGFLWTAWASKDVVND